MNMSKTFNGCYCLIYSFYLLDLREIADIVAINTERELYYVPEDRFSEPRDLLSICSGLVIKPSPQRYAGNKELNVEELR